MSTAGPASHDLARLAARREELGLTLEQVAASTRIPAEHLASLEAGRLDEIPAGPYLRAYLRAYAKLLGVEEPWVEEPDAPVTPGRLPLWLVQGVAMALMVGFVGLVAWQVASGDLRLPEAGTAEPAAAEPAALGLFDQQVRLVARENTRLRVTVDGALEYDGPVAGGTELAFDGQDRIEVEVAASEEVRIAYNGEAIVPQGRQDLPRRLVFVDDVGGGRP